jgi:glycosyltransferase involved in cell wall biosynthesis
MHNQDDQTVLMTTPSLALERNVSGVASVVRAIIAASQRLEGPLKYCIKPQIIGKPDSRKRSVNWVLAQAAVPFAFVYSISRHRPCIVHINGPLNTLAILRDALLLLLARLFITRTVYHVHGGAYLHARPQAPLLRWVIARMLHHPAVVLVLSQREADSLAQLYGVEPERIRILTNAVEPPRKVSERLRDGPLRVLSIGRLSEEKGLATLCEAVETCTDLTEQIELRMYGAGELEGEITARLEMALGQRFRFGGVADADERAAAYAWADVVVMPSLWGEGLPMVLLEAMSAGVVPIATNDGSITDALRDRDNGILIPKDAPRALAEAFSRAVSMKADGTLTTYSAQAHNLVTRTYSMNEYASRLNKIYTEL